MTTPKSIKSGRANAVKARAKFATTSGPASLARVERRAKVMRLRNGGATLGQIAEAVEVSVETVRRDIELAIKDHLQVPVDEHIAAALSRIEDMRRALWKPMLQGDTKAVSELIKLEQRQAQLLGLDAPTRVSVSASGQDYAAMLAELMLEMGLTPPAALAGAIKHPPQIAAPPGPPAANEGVPPEIIDVDFEDTASEPWV